MTRITKPGVFYGMPAEEYHADPCPAPSLNSTTAGIMWHRSPAHARLAHQRLNPDHQSAESAAFDLGTAAHAVLLEGSEDRLRVIDASDWRTKAAKEARDEARAAGLTPVLPDQMSRVREMAAVASQVISRSEVRAPWVSAKSEVVLCAEWAETWLRGRLDRMSDDRFWIFDYKTVAGSAHPDAFIRGSMCKLGYDIQAAHYMTLNSLTGGPPVEEQKFVWIVQETEAPHAVSIIGAGPSVVDVATRKLDILINRWADCLKSGDWPSYPNQIAWAEVPPWELSAVMEQEDSDG